jgi:hypothetical protein
VLVLDQDREDDREQHEAEAAQEEEVRQGEHAVEEPPQALVLVVHGLAVLQARQLHRLRRRLLRHRHLQLKFVIPLPLALLRQHVVERLAHEVLQHMLALRVQLRLPQLLPLHALLLQDDHPLFVQAPAPRHRTMLHQVLLREYLLLRPRGRERVHLRLSHGQCNVIH